MRLGRYSWPITTVTEKLEITAAPVTNSSGVARAAGAVRNSRTSGVASVSEPITTGRRPIRSASRPPEQRPHRAAGQEGDQRGVAGRLRAAQDVDEVQRDEREHPVEQDGARGDHHAEAPEGGPVVLSVRTNTRDGLSPVRA